jgi:hypothetical protein
MLSAFEEAVIQNDFHLVQTYIHNGFNPTFNNNIAVKRAAGVGLLDMVKYLLSFPGVRVDVEGFAWACGNNRIDVVKFLLDHGNFSEEDIMRGYRSAMSYHNHDLAIYMQKRFGFTSYSVTMALSCKNIKLKTYL